MFLSLLRQRRAAARIDPLASRLRRPVISIGNVSVGGRGKTPLAALVARLLIDAGERPAILSRGYGRKVVDAGVTVVSDGQSVTGDLDHSGDEPLMLAQTVPGAAVLVSEQRALAGTLAETAFGCTVHILDDGFQHHQLRRDIDIVMLAEEDLTDHVLPFGRLREPIDALSDADAVVYTTGRSSVVAAGLQPCGTVFELHQRLAGVVPLPSTVPWPSGQPRVVAAAGIAGPERFFASLKAAGWTLTDTISFGDHHRFSAVDVRRLSDVISRTGAAGLLTTTKDAVRLTPYAPLPFAAAHVPLEITVTPAGQFREWLLGKVAEARA